MAEYKKLIRQRSYLKGPLTQLQQILTANVNLSAAEAQVRLKKLEEQCITFDSTQNQIDSYTPAEADQVATFERANEVERETYQNRYFAAAAQLQTIIDDAREAQELRLRAATPNIGQPAIQQTANQNQPTAQVQPRNKPKLPVIKLADFDGEYTKWMVFKNSFETTIDSDPDLTPMQKHQYLIGQLQGEARKVIEGYTITNENYGNAWKLLKDTYDNHMMIIENHLEELFNFPSISKDDKAESIRKLIWHIQTHISSLKTLKQPVEKWDTLVIHLAKKELDFPEQRDWQNHVKDHTPENMPKLDEFTKFLTERCHTMRMLGQNKPKTTSFKQPQQQKDKKYEKKVALVATEIHCKFCQGDHAVHKCELLLKLTPDQRTEDVKRKRLCMNCLNRGHYAQDCRASSCKICGERHNTLLHSDDGQKVETKESSTPIVTHCSDSPKTDSPVSIYCTQKPFSRVILSTAQVYIRDKEGKQLICRALLDPGSQTNLMTAELARRLKLPSSNETRPISGINQARTNARKVTQVQIQGIHSNFRAEIECLVLPSITEQIPQTEIDAKKIIIPKEVQLADPVYNEPGKIDILIGAALYWKILIGTPRNRLIGQPALQNTQFGWIIGGEMTETKSTTAPTCLAVTNDQLHQQMERHWKQETIPEIVHYTKEEKACEKHYSETTSRSDEGKFIVRLPLRSHIELGNSKDQAQRRLESLERRFKKSPELKEAYLEFMDDYLECQHMSLVEDTEALKSRESYFIPHQAVVRPDSITTKVRVVFDASAKTTLGTSLNDKLMPGPNLQRDLFKITLRFRTHQFVITADIAQMFRQILVHEQDRSLQLILWRNNPEQEPQAYQLNTVTYGTACAPYHAMRCLRELASLHREEYPLGARAVDEDFYMDDVLTGAKTLSAAIELQQQMSELLWQGRFLLRKFRSNEKEVLQHLKNQNKTDSLLTIDKEEALKILGLLWDSSQDTLQYQVTLPKETGMTKRVALSRIAQVFDPLGLVAPVLITGKIFMQQLWSEEVDWDQPLSADLLSEWNNYYLSLPQLNDLQIPRNVNPNNRADKFDLFGFGDASERAFGACLYAVSTDEHGTVHSHLLCSKSKVAPLKTISLPRLELEAALLLSQLYSAVKTAFVEKINQVKLWSDSTIVLGWIKTEPCLLKTFVANRIAKIQEMTENITWQHVPSEENPADLLSRGIPADGLKDNDLWWHGPHWLREENQFPAHPSEPETNLPELKNTSITLALTTTAAVLRKYSSYAKLCRVIAYCYRFRIAFTDKKKTGPLQAEELIKAEKIIAKWVQDEEFSQEQRCLREERDLPRKSPLQSLKPFLDGEGLIRVGGRLRNAEIPEMEKHQIVLPTRNYTTSLIMREEHERLRHCPPEQLLHAIRQKFWPISGRREAQKVIRRCLKCFRFRPTIPEVRMGDLPQERVKGGTRPFAVTGVDYAGPIQIRESRRRGRIHISKGYVAVFTCFATKAIHLEMVTDLTSEAFLAALSRFTARRGLCSQLFSDNGTNFVGASRELREVYEFLKNEETEITSALAEQHITWSFIPPRSPHFGGLWEAAVKSMKRHLYTVTQGKIFTFEEYSTLLTEIEAILNSRPLTPLTNDPNDLQILTPAHFLIGGSLLQPVQHNYIDIPENRLSRWQHLQKLRQQLWQRWQREYLQELQRRIKWTTSGRRVELDTLVLLIEDNVSPLQWPLGRVIEVHPGRDGEIRVVTVKTQTGNYKRAVKKLCPLPMDELDGDQGPEMEE